MSKTEDRAAKMALETFPILFSERKVCDKTNLQQERRNAYEKGYHQAEKDLKLTWKDFKFIHKITFETSRDVARNYNGEISEKEFYQEVLKRFKERKKK